MWSSGSITALEISPLKKKVCKIVGGVLSPLLCNIFLHQLDEYMVRNLRANETQSKRVEHARRNPEYRTIENKIGRLRRQLKQTQGPAREALIKELTDLERQQQKIPYYAKDAKHPSNVGYARYADDVRHITGRQIPFTERRGSEDKPPGSPTHLEAKAERDSSMSRKRRSPEGVDGFAPQDPRDTVRARLPEPQFPVMEAYIPWPSRLLTGPPR
jgi:hypothetical protein